MDSKVFISHSHQDRVTAVLLDQALRRNGAETFIDQDRIGAGDVLDNRLRNGISWCNKFLLLWSRNAAVSRWVAAEWNLAYEQRKRIIPYRLDGTTIPEPLDALVFVDASDQTRGHAQLLSSILGKDFKPTDPAQIIPGHWRASLAIAGLADVTYDLQLHSNGQISGQGQMGTSGMLGAMVGDMGLGGLLTTPIRCQGQWTYDDISKRLDLNLVAIGFGQQNHELIQMGMQGNENRVTGRDNQGRVWVFQRAS